MKILVTGANGFIGKNLIAHLHTMDPFSIYEYNKDTDPALLAVYTKDCDFVFHLAGVNRPQNTEEFMTGNCGFTSTLLAALKQNNRKVPILATSSIQAMLENPYGKSKREEEKILFQYGKETDSTVFVYRLPNVFGKWCKPNYNSVVATFCNNIANGLAITVNDPATMLNLVYIDDVIASFLAKMEKKEEYQCPLCFSVFEEVKPVYTISLGVIAQLLHSFHESRRTLSVPKLDNLFEKALYSTYLSYLPTSQFCYPLKMMTGTDGSFTEIIRTPERGQFSVNVAKPHITKGNHWHHTKNEKFLVVSGKACIQFRKIGTEEIIEYHVSSDTMEVVDIPVGYTHAIRNEGDTDLVTILWCNECFDPEHPDTYFEEI